MASNMQPSAGCRQRVTPLKTWIAQEGLVREELDLETTDDI